MSASDPLLMSSPSPRFQSRFYTGVGRVFQNRIASRIEWQIPRLMSLVGNARLARIQSPEFASAGRSWKISIIWIKSSSHHNTPVLSSLYLLDADEGESCTSTAVTFIFGVMRFGSHGAIEQGELKAAVMDRLRRESASPLPVTYGDLQSRRSELLPMDTLTITCELRITDQAPPQEGAERLPPDCRTLLAGEDEWVSQERDPTKLVDDLKEILLNEKHTDAVLKVKGKEFRVHRLILGARSPVFEAMLLIHDTEERRTGVVNIEDCDPDTFPAFLRYVYTDRVETLTAQKALHLYQTADKYQLPELKEQCLKRLKNGGVSIDNFCDVLELSLQYLDKDLTECATQFFLDYSVEVSQTPKWQQFMAQNPTTANELVIKLAKSVTRRKRKHSDCACSSTEDSFFFKFLT